MASSTPLPRPDAADRKASVLVTGGAGFIGSTLVRQWLAAEPERTSIPGFLVEAVVEAPIGAWPTSCAGLYGYDAAVLEQLLAASDDPEALRAFVDERILGAVPAR